MLLNSLDWTNTGISFIFLSSLTYTTSRVILVVIIVVSEARYKTLHSTSHRKLSEWVGVMDTASSYESEGRGFKSRLVFVFFTLFRTIVWILLKSSRQPRDIKNIYPTCSLEKHNVSSSIGSPSYRLIFIWACRSKDE